MKRVVYHVTSAGKYWRVTRVGAGRAASICESKGKTIARAKTLAKKAALSQVRVHRVDGDIQTEYTFGEDPRRSEG